MKIPALLTLVLLAALAIRCGSGSDSGQDFFISPERAQELLDKKDAVLIDLRTPAEYYESHLPESRNLDITEEDAFRKGIRDIGRRQVVIVYCRSGNSSPRAVGLLREEGFRKVWAIEGGYLAWPWPH